MCLVDPATGRLTLTDTDFALRGTIPLVLERSYRSTNIWQSDLGQGWGHTFGVQLWRDEMGHRLTFRTSDGRRVPLPVPADGKIGLNSIEGVSVSHVSLAALPWSQFADLSQGLFAVSTNGSPTLLFDARPLARYPLRGLADRSGNLVVVATGPHGMPERLEDPQGRILHFVRDERGLIVRISLRRPSSHVPLVLVEYAYDAEGNLVRAQDAAGTRTYAYDDAHRLVAHRDRAGKECLSEYDASGRCILTQGPGGVKRRTYRYDPAARRTTITDSLGNTTTMEYDEQERLIRTTDREGGVSTFSYDGDGRLVQATDQLGHTGSILFDGRGGPAGKVRPDGTIVGIISDGTGEVGKIITSLGAMLSYERDALGRVVAVSIPGRGTTEVGYDAAGNIAQVKTPFGREVRLTWSADRRRLVETDADGVVTEQELDISGRVIRFSDALGATTRYRYDATGGIAEVVQADGATRSFVRDDQGRLVQWTDEDGRTTRWEYDPAGRCVATLLPTGERVRSDYDLENRLAGVVDPGGRRHEFQYTPKGLVAEARFPDGRTLKFGHDAVGRIIELVHADGSSTNARRDERGRIAETTYSDGSVKAAVHDSENRWTHVALGGHEIVRDVTPEGHVTAESQDAFRLVREYGEAGEVVAVTDVDGRRVRYAYDVEGRVVQAEVCDGHWVDETWEAAGPPRTHRFEYDRVGNLRRWVTPSGVEEVRTYDLRRRLVEQIVMAGDRTVLRRSYTYTAVGRVVGIRDSRRGAREYEFDAMGRLIVAKHDENVRRFSWAASGERVGDLHYGAPFRVNQGAGRRYEYDRRGQVVRRSVTGGMQELVWTPRGLLEEARFPDGRRVEFTYDPHDRLIARSVGAEVRRYLWDDESLWGIRGNGDPEIRFVTVPGFVAPIEQSIGNRNFSIHVDHIGTVQELVDEQGEVAWQTPAGVWGERPETDPFARPEVDCPLGFQGQIRDEITGLYYNRYRFYDADIGRYLTPDPIGIFGGLDPYRYVPDPVNLYDRTGLECRGRADDSTLYRGDNRPPDQICGQGFAPSNPGANISVLTHVNGVPDTGSNWVSTSYEGATAERFGAYVYVIDNPGCGVEVDCDPEVQAWEQRVGGAQSEQEIMFDGGLPASRIVGFYPANDPSAFQACP